MSDDQVSSEEMDIDLSDPDAGRKAAEAAGIETPVEIIEPEELTLKPDHTSEYYAVQIRHELELAYASMITGMEHALRIGELLSQWREATPHGEWEKRVEEANVPFGTRQAQKYLQLWEDRVRAQEMAKANPSALFSLNRAVAMLSEPKVRVQAVPPGPKPAGQDIRVKGHKAGQELRQLERDVEGVGATNAEESGGGSIQKAYEGFQPPEGVEPARLTCEPNMPITDRDEGQPTGGGMRRPAAAAGAPSTLEDQYQAWRTVTAQLVKRAVAEGRGDYQASMLQSVNNYFEMNRKAVS